MCTQCKLRGDGSCLRRSRYHWSDRTPGFLWAALEQLLKLTHNTQHIVKQTHTQHIETQNTDTRVSLSSQDTTLETHTQHIVTQTHRHQGFQLLKLTHTAAETHTHKHTDTQLQIIKVTQIRHAGALLDAHTIYTESRRETKHTRHWKLTEHWKLDWISHPCK